MRTSLTKLLTAVVPFSKADEIELQRQLAQELMQKFPQRCQAAIGRVAATDRQGQVFVLRPLP